MNIKYINGPTTYVVNCDDDVINCNSTNGAVLVILPNILGSGILALQKKVFLVNDYSNTAATNNITIQATGNTVNSASSVVLDTNGENASCKALSNTEYQVDVVGESNTSSGGDTIESGTFTLSADGSTATGGVVTSLGGGIFTFTITTTKKVKLLNDIKASVDARYTPIVAPTFPSFPSSINGVSDGANQSCFDNYACRIDDSNCVSVFDSANGNGWQFQLTSITSTSMIFTATQIGAGLDITIGKWIATTGN